MASPDPRLDARAAALFMRAVELAPEARGTLLDGSCDGDAALRRRVDALLRADAALTRHEPVDPRLGSRIGSYRLVRILGSGGMGAVYEAEQESPRRSVALKLMNPAVMGRSALRRFEQESQALARLRHPGIAQIYEAGTHRPAGALPGDPGLPFFAMELIEGAKPITEFCVDNRLNTRQRLELFGLVCDAVHHGHVMGIIHRDLKPGNILVDPAGRPRIIDFGIARAADTANSPDTAPGLLMGTLRYMSPEQAGGGEPIDPRSDVYSLGVVLYELLSGRLPYDLSTRSAFEAPRIIREQAPARLSAINRSLRGDIETLTLKALEKERDRRYASAAEFAADVRRFLRHEPITARPTSRLYAMRMFARRNPGLTAGTAIAFISLSIGLAAALRQTSLARAALGESQIQEYIANLAAADAAIRAEDGGAARARLDAALPALRGWEWSYLLASADRSARSSRFPGEFVRVAAHLSPSGPQVLLTIGDDDVSLRDSFDGPDRWRLPGLAGSPHCFSADAAMVACHAGNELSVREAATGRELARITAHRAGDTIMSACFSPDGRRIATTGSDGHVRVHDRTTGARLVDLHLSDRWVWDVQISPDGRSLAFGQDGRIVLCDAGSGAAIRTLEIPAGPSLQDPRAVRFSPDGLTLAAACGEAIELWDLTNPSGPRELRGHSQLIQDLAFSPDGATLASAGLDSTVRLWSVRSGTQIDVLLGHAGFVRSVAFSADGRSLITAATDSTMKLWDLPCPPTVRVLHSGPEAAGYQAFDPRGDHLFFICGDTAWLWDLRADRPTFSRRLGRAQPVFAYGGALSPDGRFAAVSDDSGVLSLLDTTGANLWSSPQHAGRIEFVAFSPDGSRIACLSGEPDAQVLDARSGRLVLGIPRDRGSNRDLLFSPDGKSLGVIIGEAPVRFYDAASGRLLRSLEQLPSAAGCARFSPDGTLLAIGLDDGSVVLLETRGWTRIASLRGMNPEVWCLAFNADGSRLAAGSKDRAIHIWDTRTWRQLLTLRGHSGTIKSLAWSPDGRSLVSGSYDHSIRIWDPTRGISDSSPAP